MSPFFALLRQRILLADVNQINNFGADGTAPLGLNHSRPNNSGRPVFSPLATFSILTRDTFRTPLSIPL